MILAVVAGLALLAAGGADWATVAGERSIGGLTVPESSGTPGTGVAPLVVPLALGALAAGVVSAFVRGAARRVLGAVLVLTGAVAGGIVVAGWARVGDAGTVTAAPGVALAASLGVLAAGALALVAADRPSATRYTVEESERAVDDEWALAAAEDEEP